MLVGLSLVVGGVVVALAAALIGYELGGTAELLTTIAAGGLFWCGVLALVGGAVAWLVKVGVRAARED